MTVFNALVKNHLSRSAANEKRNNCEKVQTFLQNSPKVALINLITRTPLTRHSIPRIRSNQEAMIVKVASELKRTGLDIDLYVSDAYEPEIKENLEVRIFYLPTLLKSIFWPTCLPFTPQLGRRLINNYDIVVCSEAFQLSTVLAVMAKIVSKKKMKLFVWQEMARHQRLFNQWFSIVFYKLILKYLLDQHISYYIPRSELAAQFLMKQGISSNKITSVIPNGIDSTVFFPDTSLQKQNYIFYPCRLVHSKGVDILLRAFAIVYKKIPGLHLRIQGDGPDLEKYQQMAARLEIDKVVKFDIQRRNHDEMRCLYQQALLTVISSRADLVLFSAMESIACATPVIISSGVDFHENFLDSKGGLVFENENHVDLAQKIVAVLSDMPSRQRMEEEAALKSQAFTNSTISRKMMAVILSS